MYEPNVAEILSRIGPRDVVLDIGGWAQPFRRANYVLDALPYETRGWYAKLGLPASLGGGDEMFTRETWIQRDICSREPYPFADQSIDFAICSHVLEDVRDPLWVCRELIRVARRGYIEVPSRLSESIFNPELGVVGAAHHRWLVSIENDRIFFEMKYHLIHRKGLHLPAYVSRAIDESERVQWMFWDREFQYEEAPIPLGEWQIADSLRRYAQAQLRAISLRRRLTARTKLAAAAMLNRLPESVRAPLLVQIRRLTQPTSVPR
jgi:hypothetical protein